MKVLLDECLPRKFTYSLSDHECQTGPNSASPVRETAPRRGKLKCTASAAINRRLKPGVWMRLCISAWDRSDKDQQDKSSSRAPRCLPRRYLRPVFYR